MRSRGTVRPAGPLAHCGTKRRPPIPEAEAGPGRYDAFADAADAEPPPAEAAPAAEPGPPKSKASKSAKKVGNPGHGDDHWSQVRAYWLECRSVKQTAEHFGISPNSIKTRMRRENWRVEP